MSGRRRPRFAGRLGIVVAGAAVVRVAFTLLVDPQVGTISDATAYHLLGRNLADGLGYVRPFDLELLGLVRPTAEYPPLFPAVLAAASLFGVDSVDGQQLLVGTITGVTTVALVGVIGDRVAGATVGLTAAGIAALHPMLFQADAVLMTESLYATLVAGGVLLALDADAGPTTARFAGLGIVLGLGALTRGEGLLLLPVLLVGLLGRRPDARRARLVAVSLGCALAVIAPWSARNAARFDAVVPVSNNLGTLLDGANCDRVYSGRDVGLWHETFTQLGPRARELPQGEACFDGFDIEVAEFDEAEVAAHHRDEGLRYARDHPRRLPAVAAARTLRTWGLWPDWTNQWNREALEGRERAWQRAGTLVGLVLGSFAIAGAAVLLRRRASIWPLVAPVVTVTALAALTYGNQRFRAGAEPATAVLAAVGVVTAVGHLRGDRRRGRALAAGPDRDGTDRPILGRW